MTEPVANRPYMPGYGIAGPHEGHGLLPWTWAEQRLVQSRDYWLATVRPDGGPHVMPVWALWGDGAAWFSSSPQSRKTKNMAAERRAVLTTDNPRQPVVVEGVVQRVTEASAIERFTALVNAKYETDLAVAFFVENACFRLEPRRVFSLDDADFTGSPTRWVFGDEP